ncbi:MAG: 30S ribosomal protein S15 [Bdellovibrionaceae bacterium]|nr:30S ribosomal protein S15 [Pseudobdellovibrionaceae bacterium]
MAEKQDIIKGFQKNSQDTGSSSVQVALLTDKIKELTKHFKIHKKDFHSMRGLIKMVSRRKKLLSYIKKKDQTSYHKVVKDLSLRK